MRPPLRPLLTALVAAWAGVLGPVPAVPASAAPSAPAAPYSPPPFVDQCTVQQFGEGESPEVSADWPDPLCVEYAKRDITVSNGGAIDFLAAEPARFAIAVDRCQYWQQDHWSVQVAPGTTAIVRWDGSYWFDKGAGTGGALLDNFQIGEQPVGAAQAADAVEPISPQLADQIRTYGDDPDGGGGMSFTLPGGMPSCSTADESTPSGDPDPRDAGQDSGDGSAAAAPTADAPSLPDTGGGAVPALVGALALAGAAALHRRPR